VRLSVGRRDCGAESEGGAPGRESREESYGEDPGRKRGVWDGQCGRGLNTTLVNKDEIPK
jgi:hypothetical protein